MTMILTLQETTEAASDPMETYVLLREKFGESRAFLMESLGGPAADNRFSMTGLAGRAEVLVRGGHVEFRGDESVLARFREALLDAGVVSAVVGRPSVWKLEGTDAFWELPRVLSASFEVPDAGLATSLLTLYGYDAAHYIEKLPRVIPVGTDAPPDAVYSLVEALVTHHSDRTQVTVLSADGWSGPEISGVLSCLGAITDVEPPLPDVPEPDWVRDDISPEEYLAKGEICLEHIRVGDIYQVQLGHAITVRTATTPLDVYRRLRRRNPSPYMAVIHVSGSTVVCASPELFIRTDEAAVMRPIAGTAARGDEDETVKRDLLADPKERAEHLMLVDLCRNDLGRIARPGSVDTTTLMEIEKYSHVFHIVSEVQCEMDSGIDAYDAVRASFPAGTMSGAPKVRAMEIIESLETSRRGFYAGAFGLVSLHGQESVLGLAIRMTVHHDGIFTLRASAGFVADSSPIGEWNETLNKLASTYWAVCGKEIR